MGDFAIGAEGMFDSEYTPSNSTNSELNLDADTPLPIVTVRTLAIRTTLGRVTSRFHHECCTYIILDM